MPKNNSYVIKVEKNAQKGAVFANVRLYFLGLAVLFITLSTLLIIIINN